VPVKPKKDLIPEIDLDAENEAEDMFSKKDDSKDKVKKKSINELSNGILYLKGGDLREELKKFESRVCIYEISDFFSESFFETKKVVYLPI